MLKGYKIITVKTGKMLLSILIFFGLFNLRFLSTNGVQAHFVSADISLQDDSLWLQCLSHSDDNTEHRCFSKKVM